MEERNDYHVYIHILPAKTGKKFERKIVVATTLKKFDQNDYIKNPSAYSKKIVKYKPGTEKSKQCFVLAGNGKIRFYD